MRTILIALLVLLIAYGGYSYAHHPEVAARFVQDLVALITPTKPAFISSLFPSDGTNQAPASAVISEAPSAPPPHKAWTPPAVLPVQPNWTWTTSDGKIYHDVQIVRIDAACVTILHSEGGGRVPISSLPPDMQKYFNYDPVAAAEAARQFDQGVAEEKATEAGGHSTGYFSTTADYSSAVAEAKAEKKLLLLHFTGSDWCPYCQYLDREVLATSAFRNFAATNFVIVTLDFPRGFQLPDKLKEQNNSLGQKYGVRGYPTLLVTDADGHELGRTAGYNPGSGPNSVVAYLQKVCKH